MPNFLPPPECGQGVATCWAGTGRFCPRGRPARDCQSEKSVIRVCLRRPELEMPAGKQPHQTKAAEWAVPPQSPLRTPAVSQCKDSHTLQDITGCWLCSFNTSLLLRKRTFFPAKKREREREILTASLPLPTQKSWSQAGCPNLLGGEA